jgi:hypothetical protein
MKFYADRHFIYLRARTDKYKDQLQSYYKLTKEDLEEITKDWSIDLLIPVDPAKMSNPVQKPCMIHLDSAKRRIPKRSKT